MKTMVVIELGDMVVGVGSTSESAWEDARRAPVSAEELAEATEREVDMSAHEVRLSGGIVCVGERR